MPETNGGTLRKDGSLFFSSGIQTAFFDQQWKVIGHTRKVRDVTGRVEPDTGQRAGRPGDGDSGR